MSGGGEEELRRKRRQNSGEGKNVDEQTDRIFSRRLEQKERNMKTYRFRVDDVDKKKLNKEKKK